MDTNQLMGVWIKIDHARTKLAAEFKAQDAKLKADQETLNNLMLGFLAETKQTAAATKYGTFERVENILPSAASWPQIYDFIVQHNAFELLHKRLTKTFVTDYVAAYDTPPPGVKIHRELVLKVKELNNG